MKQGKDDRAPWHSRVQQEPARFRGIRRISRYVEMRDGVKLAIDLYLPSDLPFGETLPSLLHQTRYFRRARFRWPLSLWMRRRDKLLQLISKAVARGYAVVNVDVRGTGASFGTRRMEWSPDEVRDGAEIVDWIIAQPWSNGLVGAMGVSYTGTAAEMLLVNQHPAVKAACIRYSLFDTYPDVLSPGGVFNEHFVQLWSSLCAQLDCNDLAGIIGSKYGPVVAAAVLGAAPVDQDIDGETLALAIQEHAGNYDIFGTAQQVENRDDRSDEGVFLDAFSPHTYLDKITGSGTVIYGWSGWYDGAYTFSAVKRFLNVRTSGSRMILGPWDHGGWQIPDPFVKGHKSRFDQHEEVLRFFDFHLRDVDNGVANEAPVRYFTMGEARWKEADTWPPPGFVPTPLYFHEFGRLLIQRPETKGVDIYTPDNTATTGQNSRWLSQVNIFDKVIGYPDRSRQDIKLLVYDSPILEQDIEVTGHPVVTLYVRAASADAQFFVYLEDVWPGGEVAYVTEGMFRARHRKISKETPLYRVPVPYHSFAEADAMPLVHGEVAEITFDLQPISYLFHKGHAIRLAIATTDRDNFALLAELPTSIEIQRGQRWPSHIVLPIKYR